MPVRKWRTYSSILLYFTLILYMTALYLTIPSILMKCMMTLDGIAAAFLIIIGIGNFKLLNGNKWWNIFTLAVLAAIMVVAAWLLKTL